ncbi:ABC transporter ATP-binding protein [Bradyrhizobium sp. dw_411]|uniref:ABC transporter ATP-binding protein n=1 Tax=Bradyrhizobium sp. dw_411 TaxID=2720082 RepID=UPI001BD14931|nr:ABC transporter ATP-binding protein [Bradyrhizobium sp. dw_411]
MATLATMSLGPPPARVPSHSIQLAVTNAGLSIGSKCILQEIDLEVRAGEVLCIIGPSGSGKTSLLRMMGGFIRASEGAVMAQGRQVVAPSRRFAFVFQDYGRALLPWRTVRGNVELALEACETPRAERKAIAERLLYQVGLANVADAYPRQLSGGMQQRVQIARTLAQSPDMLLMDEPFGALDAMTRETLQDELLKLAAAREMTVVFVTHDLEEAIYLGDRVVALSANPGRVAEVVDVDLPRPRDQLTTREDSRFLALRHRLRGFLTEEGRR